MDPVAPASDGAPTSTARALASLAAGDASGWQAVAERHGDAMYRAAWRACGDAEVAADATQDALLRVRAAAGRFRPRGADPEASAVAWLVRIAVNRAISIAAREHRRRRRSVDLAEAPAEDAPTGEDDEVRLLRRALDELTPTDREVLELRFYGELDHAAIADALGIAETAARVRLHRALERLKRRLGRRTASCLAALAALGGDGAWRPRAASSPTAASATTTAGPIALGAVAAAALSIAVLGLATSAVGAGTRSSFDALPGATDGWTTIAADGLSPIRQPARGVRTAPGTASLLVRTAPPVGLLDDVDSVAAVDARGLQRIAALPAITRPQPLGTRSELIPAPDGGVYLLRHRRGDNAYAATEWWHADAARPDWRRIDLAAPPDAADDELLGTVTADPAGGRLIGLADKLEVGTATWVLDPSQTTWRRVPLDATALRLHRIAAVALDARRGRLLALGGSEDQRAPPRLAAARSLPLRAYSLRDNRWTHLASCPVPDYPSALACDDAGDLAIAIVHGQAWIYHPAEDRWTAWIAPPPLDAGSEPALTALGGGAFLLTATDARHRALIAIARCAPPRGR